MSAKPDIEPDDDADADDAAPEGSEADILQDALKRFDAICAAVQEERALALSDRRFVSISGAQWEGDWGDQFANSIMVEVNKTAQGVEKIITDYRANRITVDFRSVDKDADDDTAEMLNGVFRADVYASKGQQAFDNAFEEAVQGGMGAFRLVTDYEDPCDRENDAQRIGFEIIGDADQSVFWDMNARLYDKSDARFCFVVTAMSRDAFVEEHGENAIADWPDEITRPYYDWFTPDAVRVAEYYEVRERDVMIGVFENRATGEQQREEMASLSREDRAALETEGWRLLRTRRARKLEVFKTVLSGAEVLERARRVAGDCIPVVPVYGKRWFIDNMERSRGHVRLAKDPQRIYNAQIAKLVETASLAPIERPIFTPEQVAGHETSWAEANINRAPYALVNAVTGPDGTPIVQPISKIDPPQLSPVLAALLQITGSDIAELSSADDGADEVKANISAEAMDIAATRTDAKSGIYMDNMRQSMQRCGEVYLGMAREVYVEEGRELPTMDESGAQGTATLSEAHTDQQGRFRIRHDLERGRYHVISDVTEATTTRRDKTVKTLVNVATIAQQADPELAAAALNTALINMDGEGMNDLQDWIRKRLVTQGVVKPTDEEAQQLEQAKAQQQPDPQSAALMATAKAQEAQAAKDAALAQKAQADTELSRAKTTQTLAEAHKTVAEAHQAHTAAASDAAMGHTERRVGLMERVRGMFSPKGSS